MDNPFEYPADRSEFFEETNEEEALFYFTLREFEQLVKEHGVDFIMNRVDEEIFIQLCDWFLEGGDE